MKRTLAYRVALTGMLFALAIVLSVAESMLAPVFGLPPGVKLGLANVVVMYALFFSTRWQALALVLLKAGFGVLSRGLVAGLLSLCGGLLSLLVMVLLMLPKRPPSVLILSVAGALGHNLGQVLVVWLMYGAGAVYYIPVLVVAALVSGVLTALTLRVLMPALARTRPAEKDAHAHTKGPKG
ncbi:MAG: Gx transporter family protein [Oscillospiraceae bacterium]